MDMERWSREKTCQRRVLDFERRAEAGALKELRERKYETRKASIIAVLAVEESPLKSLLGASLADHLQAGDAQFTEFLFSCRLLNLALFFFFCLRFAGGRTGDRHLMADVVREFNGAAAQVPALAVFAGDGKLVRLVAFL